MTCDIYEDLSVPDRIRQRRKELGYTSQEALAAAIGTSRIHVNGWENGRHSPSEQYAAKLAEVLGGEPSCWRDEVRRPGEADLIRLLGEQLEKQTEVSRQILELLAQIRDFVAPPPPE